MKNLLLGLVFLFGIPVLTQAQCVPDTTITDIIEAPAGSRFDTVNGEVIVVMPYAQVYQNYSAAIHFKIPKDTAYLGISGTIDSVKLLSILNLPPGMSVSCTPSNCVFLGGTYGCAEMSGMPVTPDSVGLAVAIEYTVTIGTASAPIKDTLDGFYMVIQGSVDQPEFNKQRSPSVYPNPAVDKLNVEAPGFNGHVSLQISDVIGNLVYRKNFNRSGNENLEVNVSDFKPGVYLYSLNSEGKSFTGRFSISR